MLVKRMTTEFHDCYQQGLNVRREGAGTVQLAIRVGCDGRVVGLVGNVPGISKDTADCMLARAARIRFPPPDDGGAVINVNVTLRAPPGPTE